MTKVFNAKQIKTITLLFILTFIIIFIWSAFGQQSKDKSIAQLDKKAIQTRQLQASLEHSIKSMDEVDGVTVQIDETDDNIKALVDIVVFEGKELDLEQQTTIKKLINDSINNVSDEDIFLVIH